MQLTQLKLKDFRNYSQLNIKLNSGLNVIMGKNAQGKTNMLESIFLCAIGKSSRTTKDKDLILWEKPLSKVTLNFKKREIEKQIEVFLFLNQNKAIKINGIPILKMGELMGEFNAVYFSPDDLRLIKASPDERRKFMDIHLSQFSKNYFYSLNKYNKILMQRNKLLKTTPNKKTIKETIDIWDESLCAEGAKVIFYRLKFIEELNHFAKNMQSYLTDNQEHLILEYTGLIGELKDIELKFKESIKKSLDKDMDLGYTSVGPHRDDIKIIVNNIDIRHFGSQGQQRTCALSLKLAELEIFKTHTGEYPVLLLDDVLSELDKTRKDKLLQKVQNYQTILTCTDFTYNIKHTKYMVTNGKVSLVKTHK